jgi:hypothetical protein
MKKGSALTIILSFLLVTSAVPFYMGTTMGSIDNSTVYAPNSEVTIQFSVEKDIGTGPSYLLYPTNEWFQYSIDDNQNITANPTVISRNVATVTSHNGGPTQHETTYYTVKMNVGKLLEGQHKIALYIGVAASMSPNNVFPCGYRTFDPLNFTVCGPRIQATTPRTQHTIPEAFR